MGNVANQPHITKILVVDLIYLIMRLQLKCCEHEAAQALNESGDIPGAMSRDSTGARCTCPWIVVRVEGTVADESCERTRTVGQAVR